tara:strand:+ start:829 stop:1152 length:324 start_codon:yes stop_codon:yes gene_type:complete
MTFGVKFNTGAGTNNVLITNDETPPGLFLGLFSLIGNTNVSTSYINLTNVTKPVQVVTAWDTIGGTFQVPSTTVTYDFPNKTAVVTVTWFGAFGNNGKKAWFAILEA